MSLDEAELLDLLERSSPIASAFPSFEPRPEQQAMLKDVVDAFNGNKIALIEAGTGCGKSLAYLLPTLHAASKSQERVVISTNTINLQEQLFFKDIPLLLKALNLELKVVLVKGMGNYVCLRKFHESFEERIFLAPEEKEEFERLSAFVDKLREGSRSELAIRSPSLWEKMNAEHDTCNFRECPYQEDCYFFRARKEAEEAQIMIVNHHLLFAHIASLKEGEKGILPHYHRLIIDEAHNIEDVATDYFAASVSRLGLLKTIGRLAAEKGKQNHGKLPLLKQRVEKQFPKGPPEEMLSLISRLQVDLPNMRKEMLTSLIECFEMVQRRLLPSSFENEELKLRIKNSFHASDGWKACQGKVNELIDLLKKFSVTIAGIDRDITNYGHERLEESTKGIRFEMTALADRLVTSATLLEEFSKPEIPPNQVRWIEQSPPANLSFQDASLDLSKLFAKYLFDAHQTVVLCSATLTSNRSFQFIKQRLGFDLSEKAKIEKIYDSPFNYEDQALFLCPPDMPLPESSHYTQELAQIIESACDASRGSAFCLFTSYTQMKAVFDLIKDSLHKKGYTLFIQGTKSRKELIEEFKTSRSPILFGTDSFWEGVDVAGDKLRLVIIPKLPFKVPTEPIIQARSEHLQAKGLDPFREYSLPQAVVKFKQGFGRLIRTKKDRGCVLCLDSRLNTKNYGAFFIKSLPQCQKAFVGKEEAVKAIRDFFTRGRK